MATGGTTKTKEWLKTQLVNHGVSLPSSSAKKEEYQRLYDEQVAPIVANSTEFSSDDDTEPLVSNEQQSSSRPPSAQKVVRASTGNAKATSAVEAVEKRRIWVEALNDQNLFDALKANDRNVGPVVDTTRAMYQKTLLDLLIEKEKETLANIEEYLAENPDAKEQWRATGSDLHALNGVTNGNNENGFSDTDDDEALETASRTSKSSRASSKRATPVRSTPSRNSTPSVSGGSSKGIGITSTTGKGSTPSSPSGSKASTPSTSARNSVESRSKARRVSSLEDQLDLESIEAESFSTPRHTHTATSPDPLLYARVLPSTNQKYMKSTSTMRRSTYESTYEGMRNSIPEEVEEDVNERNEPRRNLKKRLSFVLILKYLALLITIVAVPFLAFYVWGITQGSFNVGEYVEQKDELDEILEKIAADEKLVQN